MHPTGLCSQQSVGLHIEWRAKSSTQTVQPYHPKLSELSVRDGCLLWGRWIIISQKLWKVILQKLHSEYMGIAKTKALAQRNVWWTGMDKGSGCFSKSCPVNPAVKQVSAVHLCIPRYGLAAPGKESTWTYLDHFREVLYVDGCPTKCHKPQQQGPLQCYDN